MSYRFIISLSTLLKIAHYSFHRGIQLFQQLLIQSPVLNITLGFAKEMHEGDPASAQVSA